MIGSSGSGVEFALPTGRLQSRWMGGPGLAAVPLDQNRLTGGWLW